MPPSAILKPPGSRTLRRTAPEPEAAVDFEIPLRSMSSQALETATVPACVGSSMLSLTVMKPLFVPSFDSNSKVGSARYIRISP